MVGWEGDGGAEGRRGIRTEGMGEAGRKNGTFNNRSVFSLDLYYLGKGYITIHNRRYRDTLNFQTFDFFLVFVV